MKELPKIDPIKIRNLRESRGLRTMDLAAKWGVSSAYISGIESGRVLCGREAITRVCLFYGVELRDILEDFMPNEFKAA